MISIPKDALKFLLVLSLLFVPGWRSPKQLHAQEDLPPSLILIETEGMSGLAELADLGLIVYETLYISKAGPTLIAAAGPLLQKEIISRGFNLSVLDEDTTAGEYMLLYGAGEDLSAAKNITEVLLVAGSMAVARTSPGEITDLIAIGLDVSPLVPVLLSAPHDVGGETTALPEAVTPSPIVQEMIEQISGEDLYSLVGGLSGSWSVLVNGQPYLFLSRYSLAPTPIKKATRYTYDFFQSLGLTTWFNDYQNDNYRNVIAQQEGLTHPDQIVMLTAHLDSISSVNNPNPASLAPGADDNASGSAALMRIAEIFSAYDFGCTLRYALFTGEEQGMLGSKAYAASFPIPGENLLGVLNLDMLGYSSKDSPAICELHTRYGNPADLAIANIFKDAVSAYGIQITPRILQDGKTFSDHSSFWNKGYPAILAIEDWTDHTPYYHMTYDRLETLNFEYYTQFARASLAAFAHMGCLLEGKLTGSVWDADSHAPIPGVSVEAWRNGELIRSTSTRADGSYQLALQPGSYSIRFFAMDYLFQYQTDLEILNGESAHLDASLTSCLFVRNARINASNWYPSVSETLFFSGTVEGGAEPINYSWDFGDGENAVGQYVSHAYENRRGYEVQLTVNNACSFPQGITEAVFVDVNLSFFPLIYNISNP